MNISLNDDQLCTLDQLAVELDQEPEEILSDALDFFLKSAEKHYDDVANATFELYELAQQKVNQALGPEIHSQQLPLFEKGASRPALLS